MNHLTKVSISNGVGGERGENSQPTETNTQSFKSLFTKTCE